MTFAFLSVTGCTSLHNLTQGSRFFRYLRPLAELKGATSLSPLWDTPSLAKGKKPKKITSDSRYQAPEAVIEKSKQSNMKLAKKFFVAFLATILQFFFIAVYEIGMARKYCYSVKFRFWDFGGFSVILEILWIVWIQNRDFSKCPSFLDYRQ